MMKKITTILATLLCCLSTQAASFNNIWANHGWLRVSANHHYLEHTDGTPFFYMADTGWLMPQRLDRDEVVYYLTACYNAGYNVIQVQTVNAVPTLNRYGQYSHNPKDPYDFSALSDTSLTYSYWNHMDFIVEQARIRGIAIAMVCIWGGQVKVGNMTKEQAVKYGEFLAKRYKKFPNIIWVIGGDIRGDVKRDVWETLATTIKKHDKKHLMTFHPRGRTCSAMWFNESPWLDFNMFQSGHRRYGQRNGDGDYTIEDHTEEDNWQYVEIAARLVPTKPVLDGEPSYERIPQGLHDVNEPKWTAADCRRYAWWSVLSGACGHAYGNASIMQFARDGVGGAYGVTYPWFEALKDDGFLQMQHLKSLILRLPFYDRFPDQSVFVGPLGKQYERPVASRGIDFIIAYIYTGAPMTIDLSKITGKTKKAWWYSPRTGRFTYIGEFKGNAKQTFTPQPPHENGNDWALVVTDASQSFDVN